MPRPTHIGWNNRPTLVERIEPDQELWFISDLHVGDATPCDVFFGKDHHLMALVDRVDRAGATLVIVGDAIDFHQAWSFTRVLRAHQELFATFSRLAREGRLIYVIGNHDYEINLFKEVLHFRVCDELHVGRRILVVHGWQYDPYLRDALGHGHGWSTTVHHMVERYLGTWLRIPLGEFYTKGNRLMFWLAHKIAMVADGWTRAMTWVGHQRSADRLHTYLTYWAQSNMGDSMGIFQGALEALDEGEFDALVCGHSHLPGVVDHGGRQYINTGSWTFASSQYVVWDGESFLCRDWITGREFTSQFYEPLLDGALYHKDFWQWWRENYMGLFRFREGEERKGNLRGWESYVRDYQHLSQLEEERLKPLREPRRDEPPDEPPTASEATPRSSPPRAREHKAAAG